MNALQQTMPEPLSIIYSIDLRIQAIVELSKGLVVADILQRRKKLKYSKLNDLRILQRLYIRTKKIYLLDYT